jgi:hypothetical protein
MIKGTLLAAALLVAITSHGAWAKDCTNASATLCKKVIDGKTFIVCTVNCGDGSPPATATVSYTEGGNKWTVSGKGGSSSHKASVSIEAPSNSSTTCTGTVSGSDCGPTTGDSLTLANIPNC